MSTKDPINWMLSDAIETLARAERLHQQFLSLQPWPARASQLGTAHRRAGDRPGNTDLVALPGVDPEMSKP